MTAWRAAAWVGAALIAALLLRNYPAGGTRGEAILPDGIYDVRSVIDGDTITLSDGRRIRFVSVDAPEMNYRHPPAEPFAGEAKEAVIEMISRSGWKVRLERCGPNTDKYGRFLRHVFVEVGGKKMMVEEELARRGLAEVKDYGGGCRHLPLLRRAEAEAREAGRGIWSLGK